mmetsp:Transcript_5304/g.13549  ORF Transcript_5304/g.13549 Transcript_5304/m.13549 type:complete len:299 (-) Transcript_5304:620-1516(-)
MTPLRHPANRDLPAVSVTARCPKRRISSSRMAEKSAYALSGCSPDECSGAACAGPPRRRAHPTDSRIWRATWLNSAWISTAESVRCSRARSRKATFVSTRSAEAAHVTVSSWLAERGESEAAGGWSHDRSILASRKRAERRGTMPTRRHSSRDTSMFCTTAASLMAVATSPPPLSAHIVMLSRSFMLPPMSPTLVRNACRSVSVPHPPLPAEEEVTDCVAQMSSLSVLASSPVLTRYPTVSSRADCAGGEPLTLVPRHAPVSCRSCCVTACRRGDWCAAGTASSSMTRRGISLPVETR